MTITNYTNFIPGSSFISNNEINLIFIIDYKSIALPTELQGHLFMLQIFSLKDTINQFILPKFNKNYYKTSEKKSMLNMIILCIIFKCLHYVIHLI